MTMDNWTYYNVPRPITVFLNNNDINNNNNNSIQFFIIYVPSQQQKGQLQTQHSLNTGNNDNNNYLMFQLPIEQGFFSNVS
jgi:hypothetical protein